MQKKGKKIVIAGSLSVLIFLMSIKETFSVTEIKVESGSEIKVVAGPGLATHVLLPTDLENDFFLLYNGENYESKDLDLLNVSIKVTSSFLQLTFNRHSKVSGIIVLSGSEDFLATVRIFKSNNPFWRFRHWVSSD